MAVYYGFLLGMVLLSLFASLFKKGGTWMLVVLLTVFAGTRLNIDNDHMMYVYDFKNAIKDLGLNKTYELCMVLIPNLGKVFFYKTDDILKFCFLTFAFLGVFTKMEAIRKYSNQYFLSFILYVSYLFIMQEMVTIRAGVASGIFLLVLRFLVEGKWKKYMLWVSTALLFHYSAVLFLIIGVVIRFNIKIKYYYFGLLGCFVVIALKLNILKLLFLDKIFPVVATYLEILEWSDEEKLNIFNFKIIFSLLFFFFFAWQYKKLENDKWFGVLFRVHIISLMVFFSLSNTAMVFSARSFDLISVVQILLFPMVLKILPSRLKVLGWAFIIAFSMLQVYYLISFVEILKPYKSWLL